MGFRASDNFRSELRDLDWDFVGQPRAGSFSQYHWYPARYVPQVPGILIGHLSEVGSKVLDPFCGSGTTLVEAQRQGRFGTGIDNNPVATLMTAAKVVDFDSDAFAAFVKTLLSDVDRRSSTSFDEAERIRLVIPRYEEQALWYEPHTLQELAVIWSAIQESSSPLRIIALAAFSSILRFACSQDKHWGWICDNVRPKVLVYRDATSLFRQKLLEYEKSAEDLHRPATSPLQEVHTGRCDVELKRYGDGHFDLVVTSPPYFGVTDYVRSQRLTYLWLDVDMDDVRSNETGARFKRHRKTALSDFLSEMSASFTEIHRVLRRDGYCAVVIGESPKRTAHLDEFETVLSQVGFTIEERIVRNLPPQRSLSPQLQTERILVCSRG